MIRAAIVLVAAALSGCSSGQGDIPLCHADMPPPARIRSDPAFENLKFHMHQAPNWQRPYASDLWADARFEYATSLQYISLPVKEPKSPEDLCAYSISMRFMMPPRAEDRRKLHVFVQSIAPGANVDASKLEARLAEALDSGDKYRKREVGGTTPIEIEAGKLFHPARGEFFFMVTVDWPAPQEEGKAKVIR